MSQQVQDLVNNTENTITAEEKQQIKDDIQKTISEESTGIIKGVSEDINESVQGSQKMIIIIIIAIIIIIGIGFIGVVYLFKKASTKGGNDRFIEDYYKSLINK